jgi:hypothetical protein
MRSTFRFLIFIIIVSCNNDKQVIDIKNKEPAEPTHKITSLVDTSSASETNLKTPIETGTVDSAKIRELLKQVSQKKDEYKSVVWVLPKNKPRYRSINGIYCYFMKDGATVSNFRFVIQYYAEDWLFIKEYRFVIDNNPYLFIPTKVDTDNGYGGYIWEWCDENIGNTEKELINALANAKNAKIKFEGSKYYNEKMITQTQLQNIRVIYELYKAMGGKFK